MRLFGLIGYPLTHSFSQEYFRRKFEAEKIRKTDYLNFPIRSLDQFRKVIYDHPELEGLNVTIPFKEEIVSYLDDVAPTAKAIGAVNTIKFEREAMEVRLVGYNTDVDGFTKSIKPLLKEQHKKALILGTGGASKAVAYGLNQLGIECQYVSRSVENTLRYQDLSQDIIQDHTIIINTTPLGMHPNNQEYPEIPYEYLTEDHLLYDLVYNPSKTLFLQKGQEKGATIKNGLEMLQIQAEKAWDIWNES